MTERTPGQRIGDSRRGERIVPMKSEVRTLGDLAREHAAANGIDPALAELAAIGKKPARYIVITTGYMPNESFPDLDAARTEIREMAELGYDPAEYTIYALIAIDPKES